MDSSLERFCCELHPLSATPATNFKAMLTICLPLPVEWSVCVHAEAHVSHLPVVLQPLHGELSWA